MSISPRTISHCSEVVPISPNQLPDLTLEPETVYSIPFGDIDSLAKDIVQRLQVLDFPIQGKCVEALLFSCETKGVHMQKRAGTNTSRPYVVEIPGGAVEQEDQTLQLASLRELLEESGISILGARPHIDGYFYFWNHVGSTTGSNKWLIKFVFGYAISGRDVWLFNDRRWDSDLKMPKGTSSILFDPEEVSDVLSITEDGLKEMILWDPNNRKIAEDTKLLVIQRQTIAMLNHIFCSLPYLEGPQKDINRICYFEKASSSGIRLKMGEDSIPIARLQREGLEGIVERVTRRNFGVHLTSP
ncbi:NUDIX hydrolase domain-like protein [Penicillium daleae]|uniref:NUDIX hydrolase domain-like protein n=1 Tax=Penicillium daleae TaxID=63821 RepID=A0AAD6CDL3_9EURO|nr:NUDIX hydrolase domain-like protein [Penicillium daleae]KAJ5460924.1 NUDIX hydrolase domain-like protein [Penicillium daleae]